MFYSRIYNVLYLFCFYMRIRLVLIEVVFLPRHCFAYLGFVVYLDCCGIFRLKCCFVYFGCFHDMCRRCCFVYLYYLLIDVIILLCYFVYLACFDVLCQNCDLVYLGVVLTMFVRGGIYPFYEGLFSRFSCVILFIWILWCFLLNQVIFLSRLVWAAVSILLSRGSILFTPSIFNIISKIKNSLGHNIKIKKNIV